MLINLYSQCKQLVYKKEYGAGGKTLTYIGVGFRVVALLNLSLTDLQRLKWLQSIIGTKVSTQ